MWNECQKPEIRAHRATEWTVIQQRCGAHGEGGGLWGGDWTQTGRREHVDLVVVV